MSEPIMTADIVEEEHYAKLAAEWEPEANQLTIVFLEGRVSTLEAEVEQQRAQLAERDATIAGLRKGEPDFRASMSRIAAEFAVKAAVFDKKPDQLMHALEDVFLAECVALARPYRNAEYAALARVQALEEALRGASVQCGNVLYNCGQSPVGNDRHVASWSNVKAFLDAAASAGRSVAARTAPADEKEGV